MGHIGYIGQGEVIINDSSALSKTQSKRDTQLFSLTLGGKGRLASKTNWLSIPGTTTLELKGEASLSNMELAKSNTLSASQTLSIAAHRYRMVIEASQHHRLAGGGSVSLSIQLGIRYDAGSGEEIGSAIELAGNYRYTSPKGLDIELRAHTLLLHQSNYQISEYKPSGDSIQ